MILFERKQVKDLKPHPLLGYNGMLDELVENEVKKAAQGDAAQKLLRQERAEELNLKMESLKADIEKNGILEPLKICMLDGEWLIVDGRHRWIAVKSLENETVPCVVVKAEAAREIILSAMLGKHLSKGARAYSAVQVHPEVALDAAKGKQMGNGFPFKSQDELAQKIGVSDKIVKQACALYRIFYDPDHKVLKVKFEKSVWTCSSIAKLLGEVDRWKTRKEETGSYEEPKVSKLDKEKQAVEVAKLTTFNRIKNADVTAKEISEGWELLDDDQLEAVAEYIDDFIDLYPIGYLERFVESAKSKLKEVADV